MFDVFQIPYSALERDHEDLLREVAEAGAGILIRGGVALGEPGVGKGSPQQWAKFQEAGLDELRREGESRTAFMVRFTLTHPHTHTNNVGTRTQAIWRKTPRPSCEARREAPRFHPRFIIADKGYASRAMFHLIRRQYNADPVIDIPRGSKKASKPSVSEILLWLSSKMVRCLGPGSLIWEIQA